MTVRKTAPRTRVSVITPAYNEVKNLPVLRQRLSTALDEAGADWEWIIIDDHSSDGTFQLIQEFSRSDARIKGIRLSRNHGSHLGVLYTTRLATGECAIVVAADLQDPPEQMVKMIEAWRDGAQVVWITREQGRSDHFLTTLLSRMYYLVMRKLFKLQEIPETGADMVLLDRRVLNALRQVEEPNVNFIVLVSWLGFRQCHIPGVRKARLHGKSKYDLSKKVKLFIDTIVSFSFLPIRWISRLGYMVAFLGMIYVLLIILNKLLGNPAEGWSSLMAMLMVFNGIQMVFLGIIGEYLWRTYDQGRKRPLVMVEDVAGDIPADEGK